ncbi:MAG: lytic transglycosylase domain-containing protein [Marinilabiliaceae bacterium]|nr:lytic transglycosylase domain-containing protein [Marinilabiliaceae bacterium]
MNREIRIWSISTSILAVGLIINLFVRSSEPVFLQPEETPQEETPQEEKIKTFEQFYGIFSLPIPEQLDFAGENVPLKKYYVRESFDRELLVNTYWQSQTILLIKRANRYFPVIEPILKENKVPDDFKYLALIESGFVPRAVSPAGAAGIWQFMKDTAKEYGLEVSNEVDERYHVEKSTEAACKYLKKAYNKYRSWTLAAAAYNAGMGGIDRQMSIQKQKNYYDILFNDETARYVFRILAIKQILSDPEQYGFYVNKEDLYRPIPFKIVEIPDSVSIENLSDFAQEHKTTYREIKDLNPWLRETALLNKTKKSYSVKVPK